MWCHWGRVVSAKVLELPARVRCDRAARELREGVIGVLKEIHRHGGDAAFHRAARDLVASVAATVRCRPNTEVTARSPRGTRHSILSKLGPAALDHRGNQGLLHRPRSQRAGARRRNRDAARRPR